MFRPVLRRLIHAKFECRMECQEQAYDLVPLATSSQHDRVPKDNLQQGQL